MILNYMGILVRIVQIPVVQVPHSYIATILALKFTGVPKYMLYRYDGGSID